MIVLTWCFQTWIVGSQTSFQGDSGLIRILENFAGECFSGWWLSHPPEKD